MKSCDGPVELTLSVVSHGQGTMISCLLQDLQDKQDISCELLITINLPEDESFLACVNSLPMPVSIIRNSVIKGYGSNHNAAFKQAKGRYFAVINPDVRLLDHSFRPLLNLIDQKHAGVCAPMALLSTGMPAPGARRFPTWRSLIAKFIRNSHNLDYLNVPYPQLVDWVSGMFMVFPREAFEQVGGFDENYFMYYEDADLCRRLGAIGLGCWVQPAVHVVHDGQYASRRNLKHFYWHLNSALRFLTR